MVTSVDQAGEVLGFYTLRESLIHSESAKYFCHHSPHCHEANSLRLAGLRTQEETDAPGALLAVIEPHYPTTGWRGRPPMALATMLRIYFMQQTKKGSKRSTNPIFPGLATL